MSEKKTIVFASGNAHKLKEVREILSDYNVVSCKEMGFNKEIVEDGNSFYENALIKAKTVSEELNLPALADDSGICVEALNNAPGIYSARYSGDGIDEHNTQKVLDEMVGKENRRAKYVCCMVYYTPSGEIATATGETFGKIGYEFKGSNGFGYDPIFISDVYGVTLAEVSAEEKNKISHRAIALKNIKKEIEKIEG